VLLQKRANLLRDRLALIAVWRVTTGLQNRALDEPGRFDFLDLGQGAIHVLTALKGQHRGLDVAALLPNVKGAERLGEPHIAPLPKGHIDVGMKA
jgi:hypothetical protein